MWKSAVFYVSNLSTIAGVLGTGDLATTAGLPENEGLSVSTGVMGVEDLATNSGVSETEGLDSGAAAVLINMGL